MKKFLALVFVLSGGIAVTAQHDAIKLYTECLPYYTLGKSEMEEMFRDSCIATQHCYSYQKNVRVVIPVVITAEGAVMGEQKDCDNSMATGQDICAEAVRLINLTTGKWVAGTIRGENAPCRLYIPLVFTATDSVQTAEVDSALIINKWPTSGPFIYTRFVYHGSTEPTPKYPAPPRTGSSTHSGTLAEGNKQTLALFRNDTNQIALQRFIVEQVTYPESERAADIQGTVYVSFQIDKDGSVSYAYIARGVSPCLDGQALRAIYLTSDQWTPATQNDKAVKLTMTVPVKFKLQDGGSGKKKKNKRK